MSKPQFIEEEIDEMCDMYMVNGYTGAIHDVMHYLNNLGYSKVNAIIIELRKEFVNKKVPEKITKLRNKYPNSTLYDKISERAYWEETNKQINKL